MVGCQSRPVTGAEWPAKRSCRPLCAPWRKPRHTSPDSEPHRNAFVSLCWKRTAVAPTGSEMPLAATVTLVGVETAGESAARGVVGVSNAPPPPGVAGVPGAPPAAAAGGRARRRHGCGRDELERFDRLGEIVERPHTHATVGRCRDEIVRRRRADQRNAVDRMRVAGGRNERALHRRRAGARVPQHDLAAVCAADEHRRLEVGKRNRGDLRRAGEDKLGPLEQIAGTPDAHDAVGSMTLPVVAVSGAVIATASSAGCARDHSSAITERLRHQRSSTNGARARRPPLAARSALLSVAERAKLASTSNR
jgi:hypothetical protein